MEFIGMIALKFAINILSYQFLTNFAKDQETALNTKKQRLNVLPVEIEVYNCV